MSLLIESLFALLLFYVLGVGIGWLIWARK
jgi:hypothetical protein